MAITTQVAATMSAQLEAFAHDSESHFQTVDPPEKRAPQPRNYRTKSGDLLPDRRVDPDRRAGRFAGHFATFRRNVRRASDRAMLRFLNEAGDRRELVEAVEIPR